MPDAGCWSLVAGRSKLTERAASIKPAAPAFTALQNAIRLVQHFRGLHEFLRISGVESEPVVMARD